ncbi:MAG: glutamate--tRNA ligase [Bacilli bacterium]
MDYNYLADLLYPDVKKDISYYEGLYKKRDLSDGAFVTRFAPSPTGKLHIGNLYAAFTSEIMAKSTNGVFYLRIEDTDQKREIENGVQEILDDLASINLSIDEGPNNGGNYGPYIQSERLEIYRTFAHYLVSKGKAYPCFCSQEYIDQMRSTQEKNKERIGYYGKYAKCRDLKIDEIKENLKLNKPYTLRLRSNGDYNKKVILKDAVKGKIEFPQNDVDSVLIKSDQTPLYHFAHVVDDYLMRTTHVVRDESWLSSYPLHAELFYDFGFPMPIYAHIAPVNKKEENGNVRKISKRKDPESRIEYYALEGIPSEVIQIYLASLMDSSFELWYLNNPDKRIDEYKFSFSNMSKSSPLFDLDKLYNISSSYFSRLKASDVYDKALEFNSKYDNEFYLLLKKYKDYSISVLNIEREIPRPRKDIKSYSSIKSIIDYMYDELFINPYDNIEIKSYYSDLPLEYYINNVYDINDTKEVWFNKIKDMCHLFGFASNTKEYKDSSSDYVGSVSDLCEIMRVALTAKTMTPDLYEILKLLGTKRVNERFNNFKEFLNKNKTV